MYLRALKAGAVNYIQRRLFSQAGGGMCGKSACMQGGCQGMMAQPSKPKASVAAKAGYRSGISRCRSPISEMYIYILK